jgi:hypothetical protein
MASNTPIPAPPPGTASAATEMVASIGELEKSGIKDDMDYTQAAGMLKHVKHHALKVEEIEESEKRPHLDNLKKVREKYAPLRERWKAAEASLKKLLADYQEKARIERLEAQRAAELAAADERDKLNKKAEKAIASGKSEKAVSLLEQAAAVVAPVVQTEAPKIAGLSFVEKWHFEVINDEVVPQEYKSTDLKKLDKVVSVLKEAAKSIPGIRVWKEMVPRSDSKQPEI